MIPITCKTSLNFKPFRDLTPDFLFGFTALLLSLFHPRPQKSTVLPQMCWFDTSTSLNMLLFYFVQKFSPARKHSSSKIQLKLALFLEAFLVPSPLSRSCHSSSFMLSPTTYKQLVICWFGSLPYKVVISLTAR